MEGAVNLTTVSTLTKGIQIMTGRKGSVVEGRSINAE